MSYCVVSDQVPHCINARNFSKKSSMFTSKIDMSHGILFCLFHLILYVPSTIFQFYRDGYSWVEPVLSYDKCVLLKDHNAVTPVRLEPAALRSRVNEPWHEIFNNVVCSTSKGSVQPVHTRSLIRVSASRLSIL